MLAAVIHQHRSLTPTLADQLAQLPEHERALCQQLCYGVLRWHSTLQFLASALLKKPLKHKDADIAALLLTGLLQLRSMRTPPHAAIAETVNAAKALGKSWATGLLNACLRNYQRGHGELEQRLALDPVAARAHPDWLLALYRQDWPEHWQDIVEANNQPPPMMLRVNRLRQSRDDYLAQLHSAGISATPIAACAQGIVLHSPCDVHALPGFDEGAVSVQDGAAQLVAPLLDIRPGQRILDACAAPGGKTCHILELEPDNTVLALDISPDRLHQIRQNTTRLGLQAQLLAADAAASGWWDGQPFDRILVDAPCSGSGVIRRHPDIKILRQPEDIGSLADTQRRILDNLWPLLKPGGLMVYTTCSAFKQENEQQVEAFLQRHEDAEVPAITSPPARARPFGYQRLPGEDAMDGFFYACLRRR